MLHGVTAVDSSRRRFLRRATAFTALALTGGCASESSQAKAIGNRGDKSRPTAAIIDTHTHFYDPKRREGVPWPPKGDPILYRTVLPEEYRQLAQPLGITGTVVVEASPRVEDNQWVLDLATQEPFLRGLIGHLDPGTPTFRDLLNRFHKNNRFKGIRIGVWDPKTQFNRAEVIADLQAVADMGLVVDVLVSPAQLLSVADLADKLPSLPLVIDHCANVTIDGKEPSPIWTTGIQALARRHNVHMKVSGLVEGTGKSDGNAPGDTGYYLPVLNTLWNTFGPDRLIFGSNWPVSSRFAPLSTVKGLVTEYFRSHGEEASQSYFAGNAQRVYRWG
jgi:predicted TIM-barrel fold metal-dependent hydrolase